MFVLFKNEEANTYFKASQQVVQELGRTHPESYLGPNQAFAVEIFCENS